MAVLQEYKCVCCGGSIAFDSSAQKMKCPYCDTEFEMADLLSYDEELRNESADNMSWESVGASEWTEGEQDGLCSYVCNSCGGEIICDENTAATSCPYCSNPVVMMGKVSGSLKPDFVIPFKIDKNGAVEALKKHYGGKRLVPKVFRDQNHIEEVKGIYVPFWLFDSDADASMRFKATRTRVWSSGDNDYTETSYFSIVRDGVLGFEKVPVDGSSKIDDALMESVEPFDYSEAVDFQTAYLAGYFADKYDVTAEESINRANERIKKSTEEAFASTVEGYSIVNTEYSSVKLKNNRSRYALYPVWLLNTSWNGNNYIFAMNGQTGKMAGDLPLDKKAYRKWLFGIAGITAAAVFVLSYLLWLI